MVGLCGGSQIIQASASAIILSALGIAENTKIFIPKQLVTREGDSEGGRAEQQSAWLLTPFPKQVRCGTFAEILTLHTECACQ